MSRGKSSGRKYLLSVHLFCVFLTGFLLGCQSETEEIKPRLIQYPIPFYQRIPSCTLSFYFGIETERFKLVRNNEGTWLLYDKLTDPLEVNNLAGLDEMIFIQLELEKQLEILKHNSDNLWYHQGYSFYSK
ncbi:sulfatase/phosphatase domain-containing protein [uncultured Draconibacterium sp.]|uniref:sulfatase/phosphatase domain-containing protein n=1 Tax=uncultured Draconibacterium sp. TaxID=1573823 RepID=UPI003216E97D